MMPWIVVLALALQAASANDTDVHSIIQQSMEATRCDWQAAPEYDFSQRVRGKGGSRTSDVLMILGSPYEKLTAVNGAPLTAAQQEKEQQKLEQAIEQRRRESPEERNRRVAQYMKERKRDQSFLAELTRAFDFKLEGEQKLGSREVYVLRATPKPGYQPPNMETEALKGMQGRLWIDKNTFQWVKVEAQVIHPINIEGFLARVEPGTRFALEQMPVEDDIWLPSHFTMRSRAKVMFLFSQKSQDDETYWAYRKADNNPGSPRAPNDPQRRP